MQKRPSIKALIAESHRFVWENRDWALAYSMPLIIPIVIFSALSQLAGYYYELFGVFELGVVYLYACFALSWHRAFLIAPRSEYTVSPFHLKQGEGKFLLTVCALGLGPILVILCAAIPVLLGKIIGGEVGILIGTLFVIPILIYGSIKLARCFFVLPARSMNVAMSLNEAHQISRGLLMPFLVSSTMLVILFCAVTFLPTAVIMAQDFLDYYAYMESLEDLSAQPTAEEVNSVVEGLYSFQITLMLFVFVTLPSIPLWIYTIALNVGILSRLYQWAVQERG